MENQNVEWKESWCDEYLNGYVDLLMHRAAVWKSGAMIKAL